MAAFFIASFLRLYELSNRPMHVDEAVHAVKFGELLEHNNYKYDPVEYHGPALNYLTLLPARISGSETFRDISETTLRVVPAACGILMLLFFLFLKKELNDRFFIFMVLLTSFSSLLVFYDRYYIQESLLTSFTFILIISLHKFSVTGKSIWIVLSGISAGLMFASKETSIISFFCIAAAVLTVKYSTGGYPKKSGSKIPHILIFISVFITVSYLFFSSFFSNPDGAADSLRAIGNYLTKAGHFPDHNQPWYYYFSLIFWGKIDAFYFTELFISIFFIFGASALILKWKNEKGENVFVKTILIFTILTAVIYSAIPYKTPWSMMTFWSGIIIVSAYGVSAAIDKSRGSLRNFVLLTAGIGMFHQVWQSYNISFNYSFHPQNPFVYSQSAPDVIRISEKLKEISSVLPEKEDKLINITADKNDYWPLPWYLRGLENVAWNEKLSPDVYRYPVILTTPRLEAELIEKLYSQTPAGGVNLYVPLFERYMELRPGVEIRGYIRKDISDKFDRTR